MKANKLLTMIVVAVITLALLPVQAASAQATFTECDAQLTVTGFEEGTVTLVGPNTHIRGRVVVFQQISDNPLCAGTITVVANYNLDANGDGPKWGTFYWEALPDASFSGDFAGTFTGRSEEYTVISWVHAIGHGYGDLEEFLLHEYLDLNISLAPPQGLAALTILDPHGD